MFGLDGVAYGILNVLRTIGELLWKGIQWVYKQLIAYGRWIAKNPEWGLTSLCLLIVWLSP